MKASQCGKLLAFLHRALSAKECAAEGVTCSQHQGLAARVPRQPRCSEAGQRDMHAGGTLGSPEVQLGVACARVARARTSRLFTHMHGSPGGTGFSFGASSQPCSVASPPSARTHTAASPQHLWTPPGGWWPGTTVRSAQGAPAAAARPAPVCLFPTPTLLWASSRSA